VKEENLRTTLLNLLMPSLGHLWRRISVGAFQATLAVIALALSLLACGENTVQEPASNPKPFASTSLHRLPHASSAAFGSGRRRSKQKNLV